MEELVRRLREELDQNAWTRNLKIEVQGFNGNANFILLTGTTYNYYQKIQAQETVRKLIQSGNHPYTIQNQIEVR